PPGSLAHRRASPERAMRTGQRQGGVDASGKRLDVRLPRRALRGHKETKDLDGLFAYHAELHYNAWLDTRALAGCDVDSLSVVGSEHNGPFNHIEDLGSAVRVGRCTPANVHRDVAKLIDERLVRHDLG